MGAISLPPGNSGADWLNKFEKDGFAVIDAFTDFSTSLLLLEELRNEEEKFHKAGVGKDQDYQILHTLRGDYIHWLNLDENRPATNSYIHRLHEMRTEINRNFYLGLQDLEIHFTKYPVGTRYARHVDAFSNDDNRRVSVVLYLNPSWYPGAGGSLMIYPPEKEAVEIDPKAGRLVVFESTLEHEVIPATIERHSITGWMLRERRFF